MPRLTVLNEPVPPELPAAAGAVIDTVHPHQGARARFSRPGPFPVAGLVWEPSGSPDPSSHARDGAVRFDLEEHVGWLADDPDAADPVDVVKQVSFLHADPAVSLDEFRHHYRHHVEVARRHMPALWQYVQYDVGALDAAGSAGHLDTARGIVAVSVLWFRSTADFLERYFASPEDEARFRAQEGFLDLPRAFTFVGTSHPSAGPAARP